VLTTPTVSAFATQIRRLDRLNVMALHILR
jgi:hypothetical protein